MEEETQGVEIAGFAGVCEAVLGCPLWLTLGVERAVGVVVFVAAVRLELSSSRL